MIELLNSDVVCLAVCLSFIFFAKEFYIAKCLVGATAGFFRFRK
jgi:hypothetical protein